MSYTFGNAGGTTWGLKTYNQIFAPNSETVGAAEYWDKSNVQDFDTVICSTNYQLLTAKYITDRGGRALFWYGTGIYVCDRVGVNVNHGDYVITSNSTPGTVRPLIQIATATSASLENNRRYAFGVVLASSAAETWALVATSGVWPILIDATSSWDGNRVIMPIKDATNQSTVFDGTGAIGAFGQTYPVNGLTWPTSPSGNWDASVQAGPGFPIIRSTAATPASGDIKDGGLILMWGTARETFV